MGAGYGRSHGNYNLKDGEELGFFHNKTKPSTVEQTKLCVCKKNGTIEWFNCDDLEVYKVDGKTLDSIFG